MISKEYRSTSVPGFNIYKDGKVFKYIKFLPYSWGGSVYTTSDPNVIEGIENTHLFKVGVIKLFKVTGDETAPVEAVAEPEATEERELEKVEVTDLDEAKDYLVDNFGYKRSKLRSSVAIKEAASAHDIEFVGI